MPGEARKQSYLSEIEHQTLLLGILRNLQPEHVQNAFSRTPCPRREWCPLWFAGNGVSAGTVFCC